ncbi:UDP-glucose dehydrogenase family protein [Bacillus cereus]|uniref:UDP-glucose 6-dehydrogenase n=1 Tax=Bacillus cereus HuA2-1 TaxID=1053201 RepID=J9BJF1_BACCE|nr:UDP-glucose/GDP-mannose dehydrogenase family protein [Bacillus cereus]EJV74125.1 nucleotide sugar dehydrogenase [Bacillus cereus HuA2-1]
MQISIFGTGYVGLITGVCLAKIGHNVICVDTDHKKISNLQKGICTIHEPELPELLRQNIRLGNLKFTTNFSQVLKQTNIVFITVGTPPNQNGTVNLTYIEQVALNIARNINKDTIIVIKSTVPVGTNQYIKRIIEDNLLIKVNISVVANPEFLREGTAIYDTLYGDRIIIGSDDTHAAQVVEEIYKPFGVPIFKTNIVNTELIKYASNAFLATKISFINEIANICDRLDANVEEVAYGMGLDNRINTSYLKAGIGYGGSCFPKDTQALVQMAGNVDYEFKLLKSVIEVNNYQQLLLVHKAKERLDSFDNKTVAILGLAFKPDTDDIRESAAIPVITELVKMGAKVKAYDPVAIENAKKHLPREVEYHVSIDKTIEDVDAVFILTEWREITEYSLDNFIKLTKTPLIFDGRNCYSLKDVRKYNLDYYSVGRKTVCKINSLL